ncbi:hypothetical protein QZH41_019998 [Actinostola sp. cb2023]|nr:hypothetical protein QZH41_019998 [Actinostola sp. cb2023]
MAGVTGQFDDCDDTPREVDLLTEEHIEDLLDAVECLQGKVEQLQIECEKLIYEKGKVEDQLILHEKESLEKVGHREREMSALRKLNIQLVAKVKTGEDSKAIPAWAKTSLDAEKAMDEKVEAEQQVKSLQILVREKDKQISNLEWQIMDAEATVTSIQAERDRLAVELDCMLAREEENLESYQDSSDERVVFSDDEFDNPKLTQSCKKNPRRHLSDLTRREDSQIDDFTEFVRQGKQVITLSDNDVASATNAEFLGGLKRTTNFSNINDMDGFVDFHQDEGVGGDSCSIDLCSSFPSSKMKSLTSSCWHSFGSDSDGGISSIKNTNSAAWVLSDVPSATAPNHKDTNEEGCFDDAGDWTLDVEPAPLGTLVGCKNESCRSSSSAYFSDNSTNDTGQDPWIFTPDSIIDVSTGEELKLTPSGSKNSLTEENEINFKPLEAAVVSKQDIKLSVPDIRTISSERNHNSNNTTGQEEVLKYLPASKTSHNHKMDSISVHRVQNGLDHNALDSASFERTSSVRSDGAMESASKEPVHHKRINSEPLPQSPTRRFSEDVEGMVKLQAYQKWRMSGGKGQPPSKLKISQ